MDGQLCYVIGRDAQEYLVRGCYGQRCGLVVL